MQIRQKLTALREGHRRVIAVQMEKLVGPISSGDAAALIGVINKQAEIIRKLNEDIINHSDTEDIVTELVESDEYLINLDQQVRNLSRSRISVTPYTEDSTERQAGNNTTRVAEECTSTHSEDTTEATSTVSTQLAATSTSSVNSHHKLQKVTALNPDVLPFNDSASCIGTSMLHSQTPSRPKALLKTAAGQVSSPHSTVDANNLLDEGAQRTFITENFLADDLNLQYTGRENVSLSSFDDSLEQKEEVHTATHTDHTPMTSSSPSDGSRPSCFWPERTTLLRRDIAMCAKSVAPTTGDISMAKRQGRHPRRFHGREKTRASYKLRHRTTLKGVQATTRSDEQTRWDAQRLCYGKPGDTNYRRSGCGVHANSLLTWRVNEASGQRRLRSHTEVT